MWRTLLMCKQYFSYNHIHKIIQKTADEIVKSGFEPDYHLAIGGGGFIPARIMRTFIDKPIITVTLSRYNDDKEMVDIPIKHQWIDDMHVDIKGKKILLVDEIDDARTTLEYCIKELLKHEPEEIAVFVLHNKLKDKAGEIPAEVKKIYIGEDIEDKWIVYPWESTDIDEHEKNAKIND